MMRREEGGELWRQAGRAAVLRLQPVDAVQGFLEVERLPRGAVHRLSFRRSGQDAPLERDQNPHVIPGQEVPLFRAKRLRKIPLASMAKRVLTSLYPGPGYCVPFSV